MPDDIVLKVVLESDLADKSVGDLKRDFKDLTRQINETKIGTAEYKSTLASLGIVKGGLEDLKQQIKALNPERQFAAFAKVGSTVASGFAAAQAATALFGKENEDLMKVLVRVQAATALASGLQGLAGFGKALQTAGMALKAFALTNPFTAIAVGIVAVIALIAKFTDGLWGASKSYQANVDAANKQLGIEQKKLESITLQENILRLQGKSEKEILEAKIKQTDEVIRASEASLISTKEQINAQIEVAKRNRDVLEGYIKLVSAPLTLLLKGIDLAGEALGKQFGLVDKFAGGLAEMVFDPKAMEDEGLKTIEAAEKSLAELKDQRAGFQIAINKIDQEATKKTEDEATKKLKEIKEFLDEKKKIEQENINEKYAFEKKAEEDAINEKLSNEKLSRNLAGLQQAQADADVDAEKTKRREAMIKEFKEMVASQSFKAIGELALAFAGKSEASQRHAFAINKAAGIASTTIDTFIAAQKAYASQVLPGDPSSVIRGYVAAALVTAQGLARVAIIAKTQFGGTSGGNGPSPGSGGGGAPSISSLQAQENTFQKTQSTQTQTNEQGDFTGFQGAGARPIRAYVVETEISAVQSNVRNIEERSKY